MMKRDVLIVVLSTAAYGAVLAAWRSPLMAAYVAVKLPVVFVATTLVVSAFCWAAGLLCRAGLRYREVLGAVFSAMAVAGSILLALSPVVLYFVFSGAPDAGTREEMRFAHATMMMVHILVLACAGATGNLVLCRALRRRVPPACRLAPMVALWIASFAVVGCQLGRIRRPLVGSAHIAVEFLRSYALDSNFLESLFSQIIPHIISKGAVP